MTGYVVKGYQSLYLKSNGKVVHGRAEATRFPTLARAEEMARKAGHGWRVVPLSKPDTRTP